MDSENTYGSREYGSRESCYGSRESCKNRAVTVAAVTEGINELMKAGRDQNEKRNKESAAGRKEDRPEPSEYVKAFMELYDKAKVKEIKYSRYTTPHWQPHLVGKVSLIASL